MNRDFKNLLLGTFVISSFLIPGISAYGQSLDDVRTAMAHNDLSTALKKAREFADANPSDAVGQQVQGIMELANNHTRDALDAFTRAVEQGDALEKTETGLEKYDYRGSILHESLNHYKVSISLSAGGAEAFNNRAAIRIVLGYVDDAIQDLDEAMRKEPHWGMPSANAAVAWLESNSPKTAKKYARQAIDFNEVTAKVYTSLAECQIRQRQWRDAEDSLKRAEDKDGAFPYELYLHSQWFKAQNLARDEQRALFQAISLDPNVVAEGRYRARNSVNMSGGSQSTDNEHIFNRFQIGDDNSFQNTIERDRGSVDDRAKSYQHHDFSRTIFGRDAGLSYSALYTSFLNENGGRPGGVESFSVPNATFGFRRTNLAGFQSLNFGKDSQLMLLGIYRHNAVNERSDPSNPSFNPLTDDQIGLEGRFDERLKSGMHIYTGFAWSQIKRRLVQAPPGDPLSGPNYASPVEPNEQILPNGTNTLKTIYIITQKNLKPEMFGAAGPIMGGRGSTFFILPYLDLHWQRNPKVAFRFAALPRMTNANSDLLPIWSISDTPQTNPFSREGNNLHEFNRQPLIEGPNGRSMSYEFTVSNLLRTGNWLTTTFFHRQLRDMEMLSQDSQLSPILMITDLPKGETTGIDIHYRQPLPGNFGIELGGVYQHTHSSLNNSGSPDSISIAGIPNWQGSLGLDYADPSWTVSVKTIHIGPRTTIEQTPLPRAIGDLCGNCTYEYATVAAITMFEIYATRHISPTKEFFIHIFPASGAGYYFDYPAKPIVQFGIRQAF